MPSPILSTWIPESDCMVPSLLEAISKIGMRDRAKALRAFTKRAPAQIGDAILGDDEVDIRARRRHRPALERGNDPRVLAVGRGRGQRNDRAAAGRCDRTAHEVRL